MLYAFGSPFLLSYDFFEHLEQLKPYAVGGILGIRDDPILLSRKSELREGGGNHFRSSLGRRITK